MCGVEIQDAIARIGANALDIVQGDIETMPLTYEKQSFDYIIFADVLEHLRDPEKMLKRLAPYLKENGKYLCSVPNILNKHVISNLLMGELEYQDAGILDRTHLRFFTLDSITKAFKRCGFEIAQLMASYDNSVLEPEERRIACGAVPCSAFGGPGTVPGLSILCLRTKDAGECMKKK